MQLLARFEDMSDPAHLGGRWRALEERAAAPSFFLRWTWIGSWLDALAVAGQPLPRLLVLADDAGDAAFALTGAGRVRRQLGSVPALWLNEAGQREADRPFIEYNGLLARKGAEAAAIHGFCDAMAALPDWRALHLSGLPFGSPLIDVPGVRRQRVRDAMPACYVDLDRVRRSEGGYLALLSANTRGQIRRSLKDEAAPLSVECAEDQASIDVWLDEMRRLNAGRHADNAWDSVFFRDFARRVALAGLADGTVELLRLSGREGATGYLLNFVWASRAMNYQSAFAPPRTDKSKPGLMCHAAVVERYAAAGLSRYSLLAGRDRYKQSLSTGAEELFWWTLERADWRLDAEAALRKLLRRFRPGPDPSS